MNQQQKTLFLLATVLAVALAALLVWGPQRHEPKPEEPENSQAVPFDEPYAPEPDEPEEQPQYPPSGRFLDGTTIVHKNLRHGYHVSIILNEGGKPYVYQGSPPKANRQEYEQYVKRTGRLLPSRGGLVYTPPNPPYTLEEVKKMKAKADELLGTKYRPWHIGKGMNCAEIVANILNASGRHHFVPEDCVPDDFCDKKGSPSGPLNQGQQQDGDKGVSVQSATPSDMPTDIVVPDGP